MYRRSLLTGEHEQSCNYVGKIEASNLVTRVIELRKFLEKRFPNFRGINNLAAML